MIIDEDCVDGVEWNSPFQKTVGTSLIQLSTITKVTRGVQLKADPNNAGSIYVGKSDLTTSNGYILNKDEDIFIPIDNPSVLYAIASTTGQILYVMVF